MSDDGAMSDTEWFLQQLANKKAKEADAVVQAKEAVKGQGKEPFDLAKLEALCDLSAGFGTRPPDAQLIKKYEEKYYVQYPEIMTLKDFAALLETLDVYS